jgi:hypothetical protein
LFTDDDGDDEVDEEEGDEGQKIMIMKKKLIRGSIQKFPD